MSEQTRYRDARGYRMRKRAERHRRYPPAHRRGGRAPARDHRAGGDEISALAEEAGVTRLTVYRHFPDDRALFTACSAHWAAGQVMPDPQAWSWASDPAQRMRAGVSDLDRFYRAAEPMLTNVRRDRGGGPQRAAGADRRDRCSVPRRLAAGVHRP